MGGGKFVHRGRTIFPLWLSTAVVARRVRRHCHRHESTYASELGHLPGLERRRGRRTDAEAVEVALLAGGTARRIRRRARTAGPFGGLPRGRAHDARPDLLLRRLRGV